MEKEINWLLQEKYRGKPTAKFEKDVRRLQKGEPLDFVIGFVEFFGCKIDLSKRPLIPRFETEFWAEAAIDQMKKEKKPLKILDMFAGSGCIGIAILKHLKNSQVVFAEKDKSAIAQIKINCVLNGIDKKRFQIIQSDIFSNVQGTFDYILANPPYIPTTQKHKIQKSVLDYESPAALFGGRDGLFFMRKFLADAVAKNFLKPGGKIYMEFDTPQKEQLQALLKTMRYKRWQFCQDQYQKFRYVIVCNKV